MSDFRPDNVLDNDPTKFGPGQSGFRNESALNAGDGSLIDAAVFDQLFEGLARLFDAQNGPASASVLDCFKDNLYEHHRMRRATVSNPSGQSTFQVNANQVSNQIGVISMNSIFAGDGNVFSVVKTGETTQMRFGGSEGGTSIGTLSFDGNFNPRFRAGTGRDTVLTIGKTEPTADQTTLILGGEISSLIFQNDGVDSYRWRSGNSGGTLSLSAINNGSTSDAIRLFKQNNNLLLSPEDGDLIIGRSSGGNMLVRPLSTWGGGGTSVSQIRMLGAAGSNISRFTFGEASGVETATWTKTVTGDLELTGNVGPIGGAKRQKDLFKFDIAGDTGTIEIGENLTSAGDVDQRVITRAPLILGDLGVEPTNQDSRGATVFSRDGQVLMREGSQTSGATLVALETSRTIGRAFRVGAASAGISNAQTGYFYPNPGAGFALTATASNANGGGLFQVMPMADGGIRRYLARFVIDEMNFNVITGKRVIYRMEYQVGGSTTWINDIPGHDEITRIAQGVQASIGNTAQSFDSAIFGFTCQAILPVGPPGIRVRIVLQIRNQGNLSQSTAVNIRNAVFTLDPIEGVQ